MISIGSRIILQVWQKSTILNRRANFVPLCLCAFVPCLLIFLFPWYCSPAAASVSDKSGSYKYEKKKDEAKEQKKFIARLKEDKNKCNMSIENTKILIDKSRNRPYLPELYLRLAELYIEKSRLVYFLRRAETGDSVKSLEQLESNGLKNQAIEIYQRILDNFPEFEDRDKVRFFMAHEYRELGQLDDMIEQYRAIITEEKNSSYVPEVYLLLGDYFFNVQDLDLARRNYSAVLNYPQSSAVAIARYKLAWCYINQTDFKEAIKLFEAAVTSATDSTKMEIDTYNRVDIRLEALTDMAYCYGECYKDSSPEEAIAYFEKFAWSRPVYTLALEKLAYRYLIRNKWHHAAVIYRQLSLLRHDAEKLLEYSRKIFECVKALDRFEAADQDVAIMIKALRAQKYSVHIPEQEKEKNMADYELYARDIITHLHNKARGARDKGQAAAADFARSADSYELYLEFFDRSPAYEEMEANYAEALFSSGQYLEAGKQYEKLAQKGGNKQGNKQNEKQSHKQSEAYSAVISYYNALKQKKDLNYYQIAQAREGLKAVGKSYAKDFPNSERVPDVLFNVAWITYDEGKYDEAITEFSRFVERYPGGREAKAAIHLILDAFHMKEDYEGLVKYGQNVLRNDKIGDRELKQEIKSIVAAAESKIVYSLTLSAVNDWEKGREDVLDFVEQQGSSSVGEKALYALILPSKEKGDLKTLFSAGSKFISDYPTSARIEDTLKIMIDSSLRMAQFRLLARYLEKFAASFPKHTDIVDFLYQAGHIRETLGQYDLAGQDYQLILNRTPKAGPRREEIVLAIADNAGRMGNRKLALKVLSDQIDSLSTTGQIKARADIADLYFQSGEFNRAQKYRSEALKAYKTKACKTRQAGQDVSIRNSMARMEFSASQGHFIKYMDMQLKKGIIDNNLVSGKAGLLEDLEKGYRAVIQYQSPEWALAACYRSFEINKEFARFLKESPLPDLTPGEKEQYVQIIDQKVQGYTEKANQYLHACLDRAHTWEICDPRLAAYFVDRSEQSGQSGQSGQPDRFVQSGQSGQSGQQSVFSKPSVEVTTQCLKEGSLRDLHDKLAQDPNDVNTLLALAGAYREKEDFRLSVLIAQKALQAHLGQAHLGQAHLDRANPAQANPVAAMKAKPLKAKVYNSLGVSYLYSGDDQSAKDAFNKALELDPQNIGARINLASLYKYYGHTAKADSLYQTLPDKGMVENAESLIHPKAREFYYAYLKGCEKLPATVSNTFGTVF